MIFCSVFKGKKQSVESIFGLLNSAVKATSNSLALTELDNERVSLGEALSIKKLRPYSFRCAFGSTINCQFNYIAHSNTQVLRVEYSDDSLALVDYLLDEFLSFDTFVQAWRMDSMVDFLQNSTDPIEYTARGLSLSDVKIIPNDMPPPLNRDVIDISRNPGRKIFREGFVEVLSSEMWFGRTFNIHVPSWGDEFILNWSKNDFSVTYIQFDFDFLLKDDVTEKADKIREYIYGSK